MSTKRSIIRMIKARLECEYRKHQYWSEDDEWMDIAATKIFRELAETGCLKKSCGFVRKSKNWFVSLQNRIDKLLKPLP